MNDPYRTTPPVVPAPWSLSRALIRFAIVTIVGVVGFGAACITPKTVKSALDVGQVACILVNDWLDEDHAVAKACDIADDYLPEVRKLVAARKRAAAMKASMSLDGGPINTDSGVSHD